MTMTHIPSLEQTPSQKVVDFLEKKGKLELWAGTIAAKGLAFGQKQQERNQASEDAFTRRTLWGEKPEDNSGDNMGGHTILGDIIVPQSAPPVQPQQPSSGMGKVLAGAALGAAMLGIPVVGIGGYLAGQYRSKPAEAEPQQPADTETVGLGLLRVGDLQNVDSEQ